MVLFPEGMSFADVGKRKGQAPQQVHESHHRRAVRQLPTPGPEGMGCPFIMACVFLACVEEDRGWLANSRRHVRECPRTCFTAYTLHLVELSSLVPMHKISVVSLRQSRCFF